MLRHIEATIIIFKLFIAKPSIYNLAADNSFG
jgi:hypothetical protein